MGKTNVITDFASSEESQIQPPLRLEKIRIRNFKALDDVSLDLPLPKMSNDPDVLVMGSKNGLGKTSFLEACCLLFFAGVSRDSSNLAITTLSELYFKDLLIKSGINQAHIEGIFSVGEKRVYISVSLLRGTTEVKVRKEQETAAALEALLKRNWFDISANLLSSLLGLTSEPIVLPSFLYLHSYRKIQEGSSELGRLLQNDNGFGETRYGHENFLSKFKSEVLRLMMSRAGLFENIDEQEADEALAILNTLVTTYADGKILNLRASPESTVEIRITAKDGKSSYSFDGLSSGQKEIISTLFLIWRYTKNQPGIVLIDEPELHLNPEWQLGLVSTLNKLAPDNQYIMATHSEDIFSSVAKDRRIILDPNKE